MGARAALIRVIFMDRQFRQVDVFADEPFRGNPVAVVHGADGLTTAQMQRFANWMNLSETTFVLPPKDPRHNAQVRIFTPRHEMPFAGHPTLGTAHVVNAMHSGNGRLTL